MYYHVYITQLQNKMLKKNYLLVLINLVLAVIYINNIILMK